jgi:hypothetical protein
LIRAEARGVFANLLYHEVGHVHALRPVRQSLVRQLGLYGRELVQDLVPDGSDQHVAAPFDVHVLQLGALDQQPLWNRVT